MCCDIDKRPTAGDRDVRSGEIQYGVEQDHCGIPVLAVTANSVTLFQWATRIARVRLGYEGLDVRQCRD